MGGISNSFSDLEKGVSEKFRSDWQYLILASKMNSTLSLATLLSVIAVVTRLSNINAIGYVAIYFFFGAFISYLMAIALIVMFAPAFLREFPNYSDFSAQENSHRWILWQFYHEIQKLTGGFKLLEETVQKKLSTNINSLGRSRLPTNRAFENLVAEETIDDGNDKGRSEECKVRLYKPINFDRDILLGFAIIDGGGIEKRYVLPIREKDKDVEAKCKELFWILFTKAAKECPRSRRVTWFLVLLSVFLFLAAVGIAMFNVAFMDRTEELENCCIHLVDLRSAISGSPGLAR